MERKKSDRRMENVQNNEYHNLSSLADIIRVIKLSRVRWIGHVTHIGEKVMAKWET